MKDNEDIHKLKLGEETKLLDIRVVRVPGGWIFIDYHLENQSQSQCFVPYNGEFDPFWHQEAAQDKPGNGAQQAAAEKSPSATSGDPGKP